ncbi:conserved membrane hypothetical protein [Candidatus Desulfarcum epimagneticum]|uniref:Uncharacterized protein n=1 Tax=uncultured Desulfobacteraceae bacterium TaxID=218296 RepID=A0A484HI03_9BACT|nr:conserved membrane hypothetical protein [uncultured Desulfobacteraceae bacterium]
MIPGPNQRDFHHSKKPVARAHALADDSKNTIFSLFAVLEESKIMTHSVSAKHWGWLTGGAALGAVFFIAVLAVKPIGVSTQFVIFDAIIWDMASNDLITADKNAKSGYSSPNAYLGKSGGKYAKNARHPLNYSFVFVLAMALGGFVSFALRKTRPDRSERAVPGVWRERFGDSRAKRYAWAFIGGILSLFGARLAGGCTSGHMMSGMMQTAISGYLFAAGAFLAAVPFSILFYKKRGE